VRQPDSYSHASIASAKSSVLAAMRFLLAAQEGNVRRIRRRKWLLMGTRVFGWLVAANGRISPGPKTLWLKTRARQS